jgi:hypothetical protein
MPPLAGPAGHGAPQSSSAAQHEEPLRSSDDSQDAAELELLTCLAEQSESPAVHGEVSEVWEDATLLAYLRPPDADAALRKRISKRSKFYVWERNQLFRRMADGSVRVVPASRHQLG